MAVDTQAYDLDAEQLRDAPVFNFEKGADTFDPQLTLKGVVFGGPAARAKSIEYKFYAITKNAGAALAIWWMITQPTSWVEWTALAFFYPINILAMSLSIHRYFTHRAFETSLPMRYALGILAQLGVYGSLLTFAVDHRRHHSATDRPGDVHSPHITAHGKPLTKWKGIIYAQLGWVFDDATTDLKVFGKGLVDDPVVMFSHRTRFFWYGVSVLVLPTLWALAFGRPDAIIGTILIGGFFRAVLGLHAISAVNSFAHRFGYQRYRGPHAATNNWIVALLSLGEGWHNTHHAYPRAANTDGAWYEIDPTGMLIRGMEKLGLVWNVVRIPATARNKPIPARG